MKQLLFTGSTASYGRDLKRTCLLVSHIRSFPFMNLDIKARWSNCSSLGPPRPMVETLDGLVCLFLISEAFLSWIWTWKPDEAISLHWVSAASYGRDLRRSCLLVSHIRSFPFMNLDMKARWSNYSSLGPPHPMVETLNGLVCLFLRSEAFLSWIWTWKPGEASTLHWVRRVLR